MRQTLSAFSTLARSMTLDEIVTRLGPPARRSDEGSSVLQYPLTDGSHVEVVYGSPRTWKCIHYKSDGTRMVWVPH